MWAQNQLIIAAAVAIVIIAGLGVGLGIGLTSHKIRDAVFETIPESNTSSFLRKMRGISPTLSGFSGGGEMACLMHTILSKTFIGTASIAGSPYASVIINSEQGNQPIQKNLEFARRFSESGKIDQLGNLNNSKVFVLHASNDYIVPVHLGLKIKPYYKNISDSVDVFEDIGRVSGQGRALFPGARPQREKPQYFRFFWDI